MSRCYSLNGTDLETGIETAKGAADQRGAGHVEPDKAFTRRKIHTLVGSAGAWEGGSQTKDAAAVSVMGLPEICSSVTIAIQESQAISQPPSHRMKTRPPVSKEQQRLDRGLLESSANGDVQRVMDLLGDGASIHAHDHRALRQAAENGHAEVVRLLLDRGADIHAREDCALRWAAEKGHLEVVKLLLDRGANIHADNDSSLRMTSFNGCVELVCLLLDRGADIHAESDYSLCLASLNGHLEVACILLDRGADIHAQIDYALTCSAGNGHAEMVSFLLDRGADVLADDNFALRKSVSNGYSDAAMLLVARGANLEVGIETAKEWRAHGVLDMLNRVKRSREEKSILLAEVPKPHMAPLPGMIRM